MTGREKAITVSIVVAVLVGIFGGLGLIYQLASVEKAKRICTKYAQGGEILGFTMMDNVPVTIQAERGRCLRWAATAPK